MLDIVFNSIIPFVIILTILVFVHELGHYLAAIKNNVKVEVFSIGFGKELFGFTDNSGTRWKFSLLPLGGYVKMHGDADESSTKKSKDNIDLKKSFHNKTVPLFDFISQSYLKQLILQYDLMCRYRVI